MNLFLLAAKVAVPSALPFVLFAAKVIDEKTLTPMTVVCAIAGACWYLNGRLTRIEDAIEMLRASDRANAEHHRQTCPRRGEQRDAGANF